MDWLAFALTIEGEEKWSMLFHRIERRVATCSVSDCVGEAKQRARQMGSGLCAVINEENIVLGVVERDEWDTTAATPVEQVMKSAFTTLRPSAFVEEATELLEKNSLDAVLITTSDGKLFGIFRRQKTPGEKNQIPRAEIWA